MHEAANSNNSVKSGEKKITAPCNHMHFHEMRNDEWRGWDDHSEIIIPIIPQIICYLF